MLPRLPLPWCAATLALTIAGGAACAEVTCWPAVDALASTLPELVGESTRYRWRSLPVEFECREREVGRITVRWVSGTGAVTDARSAIAALGSHLTNDTATAVRGALERCIATAGKGGGKQRATSSRTTVVCTVGQDSATFTVQRRDNDD